MSSIETVLGEEVSVTVEFDYQPEEAQTLDYPGCDESVEINAVLVDGDQDKCIFDVLSGDVIARLEIECIEKRGA